MEIELEWNTLAARAAFHSVTKHLGEMRHGAAPPEDDQWHLTDGTDRRQPFHVEAGASTVTPHAVEHDARRAPRA